MATYHDMEPISLESTDSFDADGYVVTLASTGKVAKSTSGQAAFGINEVSTLNPVTGVAAADKQIAIVQSPRYAYVQYDVRGSGEDFDCGELVSVKLANTAGCVSKHVSTAHPATYADSTAETISDEDSTIVGIAMETVAWTSGTKTGKVKVRLLCPIAKKQ